MQKYCTSLFKHPAKNTAALLPMESGGVFVFTFLQRLFFCFFVSRCFRQRFGWCFGCGRLRHRSAGFRLSAFCGCGLGSLRLRGGCRFFCCHSCCFLRDRLCFGCRFLFGCTRFSRGLRRRESVQHPFLVLAVEILPNLKARVILHGDIHNIHAFAGYSRFDLVAAILCLLQYPALRGGGDIRFH